MCSVPLQTWAISVWRWWGWRELWRWDKSTLDWRALGTDWHRRLKSPSGCAILPTDRWQICQEFRKYTKAYTSTIRDEQKQNKQNKEDKKGLHTSWGSQKLIIFNLVKHFGHRLFFRPLPETWDQIKICRHFILLIIYQEYTTIRSCDFIRLLVVRCKHTFGHDDGAAVALEGERVIH